MAWHLWSRLRSLRHWTRTESELAEEIRFHLAEEAEERAAAGLTAEQARAAARKDFGSTALVEEDVREIWGWASAERLIQDIRYAARTLRRAPGLAAAAVGSSALGIGACSTVFAILNFAMFQRLPVDEPARLLSVSTRNLRTGEVGIQLSYPDLLDLRDAQTFEGIAGHFPMLAASIGVQGDPERHRGALVTANYFAVVRPRFVLGRGFDASRDDRPDQTPVVVLSHQLWQTRF